MPGDRNQMLVELFGEILEKQAFAFGEPASPAELAPPDGRRLRVGMSFSGPLSGKLTLAVPLALCTELAASTLGIEADENAAAQAEDAVKELLNVTCGRVLTALAGEKPVFDLSVPEVSELSADAWRSMAEGGGTAGLLVEGHPALLRLQTEG